MSRSLLSAACVIALLGSSHAQNPLFDEGREPTAPAPIRRVTFQNASLLPAQTRKQIVSAVRAQRIPAGSIAADASGLAEEVSERVRAAYQDDGYFKVQVSAKAVAVAKSPKPRYDIEIDVLEEGKQYRLGDLRVIHMTAFPEQQLRDLFPVQRGEIFSREKIGKGLEGLRDLYGSQGYINFTAVPNTVFEQSNACIGLEIDVDEGKLFHWGNLHLAGMRDQDAQSLLQAWGGMQGRLYTPDDLTLPRFLGKFFRPLRKGSRVSDYATAKVDEHAGTVDIYLNLTLNPDLLKSVGK
jgi:hypothetical protein